MRTGTQEPPRAVVDARERGTDSAAPSELRQGTGLQELWFGPWHNEFGPCCKCGAETDRWFIGAIGFTKVRSTYEILEAWPFCEHCDRQYQIDLLQRRQQNVVIDAGLRAREAVALAELIAESEAEQQEVPASPRQNGAARIPVESAEC